MGILPDEIKPAMQGVIPSHVVTCSRDGAPNATSISQVYYVDPDHVALSHQFFNKTVRNVRENPRAVVWVISPETFDAWDLEVEYDHSETSGPVFEAILRATERGLGFQHSMILLKDLAEDTLRLFASRGYDPTGVGAEVAFGEGVIGVVAERKRMMRVGSLGAGIAYITSIRARLEAAGEVAPAGAAAKLPGLPKAQSPLALPLLVKDRLVR